MSRIPLIPEPKKTGQMSREEAKAWEIVAVQLAELQRLPGTRMYDIWFRLSSALDTIAESTP